MEMLSQAAAPTSPAQCKSSSWNAELELLYYNLSAQNRNTLPMCITYRMLAFTP